MERRLSIGEFAQACGLSRSALRFYDQNGLLAPCWVDSDTAYRFYSPAQIETARLIVRLRRAEMPVALLRDYLLADPHRRTELLQQHAQAFRRRIDDVQSALAELEQELVPGAGWCAISAVAFTDALAQVSFAMADRASRPELAVIWVETRADSLRLVSTDSYRLAVRDLVPDALSGTPIRAAIAADQLPALSARRAAERLTLRQDADATLHALSPGHSAQIGAAGAGFPDYEQILSQLPSGDQAMIARHELERALQHLPGSGGPVALRFGSAGLALEAEGQVIVLSADWPGAELTVHLDRGFLTDAVGASVGPDITIEAVDPLQPLTLRSADTGTFSVLTMPVRP